uniref:Uncharacterized protein n=1 Tax=Arundo donax TaxID=35708 RepID=A0A0A9HEQ3_ARUDO
MEMKVLTRGLSLFFQ